MKPLKELVRPNIWSLAPYSSARNEYSGHTAHVFLDANENPFGSPYNRYPDPLQTQLKARISQLKGIPPQNIFLGNGSDEAIDLILRCFCEPGQDNIVAISPTYGMYQVCADINNVEYRPVPLDAHYQTTAAQLLAATDEHTKAIFLCSPNNPTGNSLRREEVLKTIEAFHGLVIVDEAYIDFSPQPTLLKDIARNPNLIVLQTLSKAWASAALRLGMAFAREDIIAILNKTKYPYNVNLLTQQQALARLGDTRPIEQWTRLLTEERERMLHAFRQLPLCQHVYPTDANFFLARVTDAQATYDYLVNQGIIVRNRTRIALCHGCLRITIGTKDENNQLLAALRQLPQTAPSPETTD